MQGLFVWGLLGNRRSAEQQSSKAVGGDTSLAPCRGREEAGTLLARVKIADGAARRSHLWGFVVIKKHYSYRTCPCKRRRGDWMGRAQSPVCPQPPEVRATSPAAVLGRDFEEKTAISVIPLLSAKTSKPLPFMSPHFNILSGRWCTLWMGIMYDKILVVSWIRPTSVCLDNSGLEWLPVRKRWSWTAREAHLFWPFARRGLRKITMTLQICRSCPYKGKIIYSTSQLLTNWNYSPDFMQWLACDDIQFWRLEFGLHSATWSL